MRAWRAGHRAARGATGREGRDAEKWRRQARLCLPRDFFDGTADRYVIGELKRLRKAGKLVQDGDNVHTLRLRLVEAGR